MTTASIGSLFSGIGGLELGLERAGLGPVVWQCEIDPFCRKVLEKHWPDATRYEDVRDFHPTERVDILCGGFPCQDLSTANVKGRLGLNGTRSGLYYQLLRVVSECIPRWVIVENTGRNWDAWVPVVRGDLRSLGYSSVSVRLSPKDLGFKHHRDRAFVVAYSDPQGEPLRTFHAKVARLCEAARRARGDERNAFTGPVRASHGVPGELDRVRALGNAVVPQVAEVIGRALLP